jgi:hypothetical protein
VKRDINFLIAATIIVIVFSGLMKSQVFGIHNPNERSLFDFALTPVLLAIVYSVNFSRIRKTMNAGLSPDFVVRPTTALGYWVVLLLAAIGAVALRDVLKGTTSPVLSGLGPISIFLMAIAVWMTAYENPEA